MFREKMHEFGSKDKQVNFKVDMRKEIKDKIKKCKSLMVECEKAKESCKEEMLKIKQEWLKMEKTIIEMKEKEIQTQTRLEVLEYKMQGIEEKNLSNTTGEELRTESGFGQKSKRGSRWNSAWSVYTDKSGVSNRAFTANKMIKIKNILYKKDRSKIRNNWVIKGMDIKGKNRIKCLKEVIKRMCERELVIEDAWMSGRVVIVKINNADDRDTIPKNKAK